MCSLLASLALCLAGWSCGAAGPGQEPVGETSAVQADPDLGATGAIGTLTVTGAPELSGLIWDGDMLCLPPATEAVIAIPGLSAFAIKGRGPGAAAQAWALAGGAASRTAGQEVKLFTPQIPDLLCDLEVTAAGGKPLRLCLAVVHEATVQQNQRTGEWQVSVDKAGIGTYPNPDTSDSWRVRLHRDAYTPPRFWMRITPQNENMTLAPHVRVGQMVGFVTEKDKTKPKRRHTDWFPPNRKLVQKMELLTRALQRRGVRFDSLAVNSGFRSPPYNRRIGGSSYSRHIYGDAVDVMVDVGDDEVCDDISGDGRVDDRDGLILGEELRTIETASLAEKGGIGVYGLLGKDSCLSFVHLDARGYVTRWGTSYRSGRRAGLEWWPASEYREDEEPPPQFKHLKTGKDAAGE